MIALKPKGFNDSQWRVFIDEGILIIPNAIDPQNLKLADQIVARLADDAPLKLNNIVGICREMAAFIDHPAYAGFVHDVYGESLRLLSSQAMVRPPAEPSERLNDWHFDGPRVLPFDLYATQLPMRIKVGVYLTNLSEENWGNLIYIPGSHHQSHIPQYKTHHPHPEQRQLLVGPGTIVLMFSGLWHRVAPNLGAHTRRNLYLEYGPSWLQNSEKQSFTPFYLDSLSRAQRIILRQYQDPNLFYKPPAADVPLYAGTSDIRYEANIPNDLKRYTPKRLQKGIHQ